MSSFLFYIQKIGLKINFIHIFIWKIIEYRSPIIKQSTCCDAITSYPGQSPRRRQRVLELLYWFEQKICYTTETNEFVIAFKNATYFLVDVIDWIEIVFMKKFSFKSSKNHFKDNWFVAKLDRVASLVAGPLRCNWTVMQNQPIWDSPPYMAVTFEPIMGFKTQMSCEMSL